MEPGAWPKRNPANSNAENTDAKLILAGAAALAFAVPAAAQTVAADAAGNVYVLTPVQQSSYDTWPVERQTIYTAWPNDYKVYYWTLAPEQQNGWWVLTDEQRGRVYGMTPEQRVPGMGSDRAPDGQHALGKRLGHRDRRHALRQ